MNLDAARARLAHPSVADYVLVWFLRIIAIYCLIYGIHYWIRLIGLFDGAEWRFDTMPLYWRTASAGLAVFFPFAAIGLWTLASWGPVIWAICALTEICMFSFFPEYFGPGWSTVVIHLAVASFYVLVRLVIYLQKKSRI